MMRWSVGGGKQITLLKDDGAKQIYFTLLNIVDSSHGEQYECLHLIRILYISVPLFWLVLF